MKYSSLSEANLKNSHIFFFRFREIRESSFLENSRKALKSQSLDSTFGLWGNTSCFFCILIESLVSVNFTNGFVIDMSVDRIKSCEMVSGSMRSEIFSVFGRDRCFIINTNNLYNINIDGHTDGRQIFKISKVCSNILMKYALLKVSIWNFTKYVTGEVFNFANV